MRNIIRRISLLLAAFMACGFFYPHLGLAAESLQAPGSLRCEYLVNPLGMDVLHPRFQWVLESAGRDEVQTAYQVLVATSREKLARGA